MHGSFDLSIFDEWTGYHSGGVENGGQLILSSLSVISAVVTCSLDYAPILTHFPDTFRAVPSAAGLKRAR